MSASNWAICPRCLDRAYAARDEQFERARLAYGKVPAEEYEAMKATALDVDLDPDSFQTFREDYEFYGAAEGVIHVDYSGHCDVCKLNLDFKDERPFYVLAARSPSRTEREEG